MPTSPGFSYSPVPPATIYWERTPYQSVSKSSAIFRRPTWIRNIRTHQPAASVHARRTRRGISRDALLPAGLLLFTHTCPVTEFAVASHLNTANSCCHHVFLRHFRFQKCLPVNSNYISSNLIQNTLSLWVRQRFFPSIKSFHFALHISYNILHIFYNDTVIRFSQIFLNHRILCETHLTNYQNKKIN